MSVFLIDMGFSDNPFRLPLPYGKKILEDKRDLGYSAALQANSCPVAGVWTGLDIRGKVQPRAPVRKHLPSSHSSI